MFDPRSEEILRLKARALCGGYLGGKLDGSDPDFQRIPQTDFDYVHMSNVGSEVALSEEQEKLKNALREVVKAEFFDLFTVFSNYFLSDPEEEFKLLLNPTETWKEIADEMEALDKLATPSEAWPRERQDAYRARMQYLFAKRRYEGLKREVEISELYLKSLKSRIESEYPGCLGEDF